MVVAAAVAAVEGGSSGRGRHHHLSKYCKKGKNVFLKMKMNQCPICYQSFSRSDVMLRHKRNVHMKEKYIDPLQPVVKSTNMTFKHPFSMVVSGPSGSRKSVWTKNYSCPL